MKIVVLITIFLFNYCLKIQGMPNNPSEAVSTVANDTSNASTKAVDNWTNPDTDNSTSPGFVNDKTENVAVDNSVRSDDNSTVENLDVGFRSGNFDFNFNGTIVKFEEENKNNTENSLRSADTNTNVNDTDTSVKTELINATRTDSIATDTVVVKSEDTNNETTGLDNNNLRNTSFSENPSENGNVAPRMLDFGGLFRTAMDVFVPTSSNNTSENDTTAVVTDGENTTITVEAANTLDNARSENATIVDQERSETNNTTKTENQKKKRDVMDIPINVLGTVKQRMNSIPGLISNLTG